MATSGLDQGTPAQPDHPSGNGPAARRRAPSVITDTGDDVVKGPGLNEQARRALDAGTTADPDADHVEIIGEIDNEGSDEDKAPTLSNERYKR